MKYYNLFTKKTLYFTIGFLKSNLYLNDDIGINISEHIRKTDKNTIIETVNFRTKGLRGMVSLPTDNNPSIILLNKNRNDAEQNYDCAHEFMHIVFDNTKQKSIYHCYDTVQDYQNKFLEWRANEGAAELLVPYKVLLPMLKEYVKNNPTLHEFNNYKRDLAKTFFVPERVIHYRIENLKFEINQFLNGTPLNEIEIMSFAEQRNKNISQMSLNTLSSNSGLFGNFNLKELPNGKWILKKDECI